MSVKSDVSLMKQASPKLAATSNELRNKALEKIAENLLKEKDKIFAANEEDLKYAKDNDVAPQVQKRLLFNEHKLEDVISGIKQLMTLDDPIGRVSLARELDEGLTLYRVSCPIGVIGVVFEARPDALVQIATLCLKSGNCAILKGGKETANTNKVLFDIVKESAKEAGLPEGILLQATAHSDIDELLDCYGLVDLLIPRGSNAFVQYIMNNTKIPVMGHADGICHIYVDEDFNEDLAIPVIVDAKTQYTAACNSVETILINRKIAKEFLPKLAKKLAENNVKLFGNKEVLEIIDAQKMEDDAYAKEYLDLCASVKIVENVDEAIEHINKFGSHHTDCIITDNDETANKFMQMVDSAGVYQNASTRFADGFRYGFGAEVGISTSKIHARGPVGLEGLVTYKYKLFGHGHVVADYANGSKTFKHRDL